MANPTNRWHVDAAAAAGSRGGGGTAAPRQSMKNDKLLILAIFVVVVGAVVGIQHFRPSGGRGGIRRQLLVPPAPVRRVDVAQMRGFSLQLQSASPSRPYDKYIGEIADAGANTICLVVAAYQENGGSTSIFVDARRVPTDERLGRLIALARRKGLRVVLMPIVLLDNPRAGEWRGQIEPKGWAKWWDKYNGYILRYARIAQQGGVDVFMVGSELVSTEKDHAPRWRRLIREVRGVFKGCLSYSANWDHYRPVSWWDEIDIVGMTTYYDLTKGKQPTVQRLLASWQPIRRDVLAWQRTINRPILFTEVGWPNQVTCAQYPWDYTRNPDKPDPTAQANCFEAFFRTWIREPSVAGFLVWEWRNAPGQDTGPKDTGYVPCGKPAMKVIQKYYQMPGAEPKATRPAASQPATARSAPATAPATRPAPAPATARN